VRVRVGRDLCSGHARCEAAAPGTFVLDDEGYNATEDHDLGADEVRGASRGALACPEQSISLLGDDGAPVDEEALRRLAGVDG
jgi:ferredoxin